MCANYGAELILFRKKFLDEINARMTEIYREIAKNEDECAISYVGTEVDENKYLSILESNFEKDRYLGYTSFGAHRDDTSSCLMVNARMDRLQEARLGA